MPKKGKGGRRHRKQASKHFQAPARANVRFAKADDEIYARVIKLYGNGMADVLCSDKITRLLQIRKKFRGRNKRDNMISIGTMVLAGLRSWEVRHADKKNKVDLLYVYSRGQLSALKKIPEIQDILPDSERRSGDSSSYDIRENATWENKVAEQPSIRNAKVTLDQPDSKKNETDVFDWDDI